MKDFFRRLNYRHFITDLLLVLLTPFLSILLRVGPEGFETFLWDLIRILPLIVCARAIAFLYFDTHKIIWRYVSAFDAVTLAKAVASSTLVIISLTYIFQLGVVPRSFYFIDAFLLLFMIAGARISRRLLHEYSTGKVIRIQGQRALIIGAGTTGQSLLKRILSEEDLKLTMVGFVDDDKTKEGMIISGYKVLGNTNELSGLILDNEIKQLVIGVPQPSPEFLKRIIEVANEYGIRPRMMASSGEKGDTLRELDLKDLLVRKPHSIDVESTRKMVAGKRVLITGAGGSIGSEISRQILSFEPSRLYLLDHSEFNLYQIDSELSQYENYKSVEVVLLDLKDRESLDRVFAEARPEIVLHAAAYKHVHLVESSPYTSILNNIWGTKNVLDMAEKYLIRNFVLISTDKAVNPVGVMGATKRICEILTSDKGFTTGMNYCSVRFGNVLGSSGSLIPKLKTQIAEGKPVTITHKDMTRYFMLIEEAVSLVLKAASIAKPGDINVLRMGEPVKILDVAKNLIQLVGKKPEEVEIQFTGLRPGEKMFEELYISGKELNTEHPDILVVPKGDNIAEAFSFEDFLQHVDLMISKAKAFDHQAIVLLNELVASKYVLKKAEFKYDN